MFDQTFQHLFRAIDRIDTQLEQADDEQKEILADELMTFRLACDRFIEKWLEFEERLADIGERHELNLDGAPEASQIAHLQQAWGHLIQGNDPIDDEDLVKWPQQAQPFKKDPLVDQENISPASLWKMPNSLFIQPQEEQIIHSFRKGMGFFDLLMFPQAIHEFEEVVKLDAEFTIARLYLALGYLGKKDFEQTIRHLKLVSVAETDPFILATIHNTYGHTYAEQGDYRQALADFSKVVELSSEFKDAHFNKAVCHYNLKQYREAVTEFESSKKLQPKDWEAERYTAYCWMHLGYPIKVKAHLDLANKYNTAFLPLMLELADLNIKIGDRETAQQIYEQMLDYNSLHTTTMGRLGWLQLESGNISSAIAWFKKQLSLAPNDSEAIFNLAWATFQSGQAELAEKMLRSLLQNDGKNPYFLAGLAEVLLKKGEVAEAKDILNQMVQEESRETKRLGLFHLGRNALEEGRYEQAQRFFSASLAYDQGAVEVWFYKGLAFQALGDHKNAESCWKHCNMNPHSKVMIV